MARATRLEAGEGSHPGRIARRRVVPTRRLPDLTVPAHRLVRGALRAAAPLLISCLCALALLAAPATPADAAPALSLAQAGGAVPVAPTTGTVWVTKVNGIIDPALAGYLVHTMKDAAKAQAAALVIEIDTPGGLDSSMRDIIQAELDAPIPIVFYVYPQGARAASAGLYILMGSDVAAAAPQTNIGAATPIAIGGTLDDTERTKVINDAAAYIRGLATNHKRNADWAEQAVRQAVSVASDEALRLNVVDFVAPDLPSLLKAIDGHVTVPKNLTLHTAGAPTKEVGMSFFQKFLHAIDDPSLAYILLILGIIGFVVGFVVPGSHHFGAIAGAVALVLAFYSLQVLPVNWAGIALIVIAFILFVAEIKIQSHGILGFLGAAALVVGGILMFHTGASYAKVGTPVLVVVAVVVVAFFTFVAQRVGRAFRRPHATGLESMVGRTGVVISPLSPEGRVRVRGESWKARSEGGDLLKDETVEVVGIDGLTLIVRHTPASKEGA